MPDIREVGPGPRPYTRVRCDAAEGLARRIGGQWRAFGWWAGVDRGQETWVENVRVPPSSGSRRKTAAAILSKLDKLGDEPTDKQLAKLFEHQAAHFHDSPVADALVDRPKLAMRCIAAARYSWGFVAAMRLMVRIGPATVPDILAEIAGDSRSYNIAYYAGALAAIDPGAVSVEHAEAVAKRLSFWVGAFETFEVVLWEELMLGLRPEVREAVIAACSLSTGKRGLFRMPRLSTDPAVAQRLLDAVLGWDDRHVKSELEDTDVDIEAVMRRIAAAVPDAVVSALGKAKGPSLRLLAAGAGAIERQDAIEACMKVLGKSGVADALRGCLPGNPGLRGALEARAGGTKTKGRALATELMLTWSGRDSALVSEQQALDEAVGAVPSGVTAACWAAIRRDGLLDDWRHIEPLLTGHGPIALARLCRCVVELIETGERRCRMDNTRWPSDLYNLLRSMTDDPTVMSAARHMLATWAITAPEDDEAAVALADAMRFRSVSPLRLVSDYWLEQAGPSRVPVLLELLRYNKPRARMVKIVERLVELGDATRGKLAPYLRKPSYAVHAATVAERLGDPAFVEPLELAIADKPAKKVVVALGSALQTCRAAATAASVKREAAEQTVVAIDRPAEIEALQAAIEGHAKGRRELPSTRQPLRWRTGAVLGDKATKGLWCMLTRLTRCAPDTVTVQVRDSLHEDARAAIVDAALDRQPISGKKAEVWSLAALGVFGDESQVRDLCDRVVAITSGGHVLAEHVVTALRHRGRGRAVLALDELSRTSGKRARLATESLDAITREAGTSRHVVSDRAFPSAGVEPRLKARVLLRLESAMILGRPWQASDFKDWITREVVRAGLHSLVLQQGRTRFVLDSDGNASDLEGAAYKLTEEAITIVHPARLDASELADAMAFAARQNLQPGFEQLQRPVVQATADELRARAEAAEETKIRDLPARFDERNYVAGEYFPDSNAIMDCVRALGHGSSIAITHDGMSNYDSPTRVSYVSWDTPWDSDDPGLLSEIARDLDVILAPPPPAIPGL